MGQNFLYQLSRLREVSTIAVRDGEDVWPTVRTLIDSGRKILEIAARNELSIEVIGKIRREFPDVIVGAGAITRSRQLAVAHNAGAQFVASLGFSESLIDEARKREIAVLSGASTPSDIIAGLDKGISTFHFHPAESLGGIPYLTALSEAFPEAGFYVTGGITPKNMKPYLALDNVIAVGLPSTSSCA